MEESRPPRRRRRLLLALLLSTAIGFVAAEGLVRALLFSENATIARVGAQVRFAYKWAEQDSDGLYWKLRYLWAPSGTRQATASNPDPLLGWLNRSVTPGVYTHEEGAPEDPRRPVLLYGDSFAQGVGPREFLYQDLFQRSAAASEHVLVNYGTGGHGLGQIYLLLRESIDHYVDRKPVVVLSILLDEDLDRTVLDFRDYPKPFVHLENDELVVDPPSHLNTEEYLKEHPATASCWLWRYLARSPRFLPGSWRARMRGDASVLERKKQVNRAIFVEIQALLGAREIDWFVLLFVNEGSMSATSPTEWEEPFLLGLLEERRIPYVITRPDLWAWARREGIDPAELYIHEQRGLNHHTRAGNEATLQTILRGLRGEFDPYEFVSGER